MEDFQASALLQSGSLQRFWSSNGILMEYWDVIQDGATAEQSKSKRPMCGATFLTHAKKAQPSRVGSRTARSRPVGGEIRMRTQHKSPTDRFLSWGYISFGYISSQSFPMLKLQKLQSPHHNT